MKEVAPPARAAARKALELDDRLSEAYAAQAYVQGMFDWEWVSAEATIGHALEIDPNNLDARYVYAMLLMALGRLPERHEQQRIDVVGIQTVGVNFERVSDRRLGAVQFPVEHPLGHRPERRTPRRADHPIPAPFAPQLLPAVPLPSC